MNLHLPKFTLSAEEIAQTPNTLRAAKRWQSGLPLVNMGETTRQFYLNLRALNRQPMPAKLRLELMELLHPTALIVLQHLQKHLKALTHPLTGKIKQVSRLTEAMMLELAVGYKHAIHQVATGSNKLDSRNLAKAVHRAMRFLEMALAHNARTYRSPASNTWHDLHRLEGFAEQLHLADAEIKDGMYVTIGSSTPRDVYKQACLLAMSQPLKLRTGEAARLQAYFEKACHLCDMKKSLIPDDHGMVHVASLKSSEPPAYIPLADITTFSNLRGFDLSRLISTLDDMLEEEDNDRCYKLPQKGEIKLERSLIQRLITTWTTQEKRRYSRVQANRTIVAASGISQIIHAINHDLNPQLSKEDLFDCQPATPEPIAENVPAFAGGRGKRPVEQPDPADSIIYHADLIGVGDQILDDAEFVEQKPPPPKSWQDWRTINTGAGGYGLRWESDEPSGIQVGEVIALREQEYTIHYWRTGIVRWLHNNDERGLEIGVQLLAPRAIVVSIETIHNRNFKEILPVEALMLPGMKTLNHPPSLLVKTGIFQAGDILDIAMLGKKLHIELGKTGECPSFFTQFFYTSSEVKGDVNNIEEFDGLWNRI